MLYNHAIGRILNEAYLSAIKRANKGCFICTFVSVFLMLLNQTVIDCLIRGLIQLRIRFYRITSKMYRSAVYVH